MLPRRHTHRHRPRDVRADHPGPRLATATDERIQITEALILDVPGQRLLGPEGEVLLSARAFELLAYLVHRPRRVLSRRELLDAVWGQADDISDRVVDQAICRLRRRIEPDPAHPRYLRTRRGAGYQYCPPLQRS